VRARERRVGINLNWLLSGVEPIFAGEGIDPLSSEESAIDQETLEKTIELVQKIKLAKKIELSPKKEAKAITLLYRLFQSEQDVHEDTAFEFMDMIAG